MENQRKRSKYTILIDADAFVALVKIDDANHQRAEDIYVALEDMSVEFYMTGYVFAEAVTVISQRISHEAAVQFIDTIKSSESSIQKLSDTREYENAAITLFKQQTSKNVSFVDCVNMAFLQAGGLEYIFSFDGAYKRNGFKTVDDLL